MESREKVEVKKVDTAKLSMCEPYLRQKAMKGGVAPY